MWVVKEMGELIRVELSLQLFVLRFVSGQVAPDFHTGFGEFLPFAVVVFLVALAVQILRIVDVRRRVNKRVFAVELVEVYYGNVSTFRNGSRRGFLNGFSRSIRFDGKMTSSFELADESVTVRNGEVCRL